MTKIAFISDIHGNLEALKSVLKDCKEQKVEKIICLGDIVAKGIHNHECIDLVKKNCDIVLSGNTDYRYSSNPEDFKSDKVEYNRLLFHQALMTPEDMQYLKSLPICYEFYFSGNLIRCFHATPETVFGFINDYDVDMKTKYLAFLPTNNTQSQLIADIAIYGHLHYPFMLSLYNKKLLNSGSVGASACAFYSEKLNSRPDEICMAHYLIVTGEYGKGINNISFDFRSVNYDIDAELMANKDTNPEYQIYYEELKFGKYRNISRINNVLEKNGYINYEFEA